jgi:hypothetical protein
MIRLLLLLFSFTLFAQDYGNNAEALELCTTLQSNSFSSDLDADNALDRILSVVGLSKNFVLSPCSGINNAVAVSYKGVRYILYDPEFMSMLSSNTSNWTNLFILAHEVGHHVNGHSLDLVLYAGDIVDAPELEKKRQQELEADEFAGFVLAKLGASLSQTTSSVSELPNEDDTYSTHPKRDKRITAIKLGYNEANITKLNITSKKQTLKSNVNTKFSAWEKTILRPWVDTEKKLKDAINKTSDPFKKGELKEMLNKTPKLIVLRAQTIGKALSKYEDDLPNKFKSYPVLTVVDSRGRYQTQSSVMRGNIYLGGLKIIEHIKEYAINNFGRFHYIHIDLDIAFKDGPTFRNVGGSRRWGTFFYNCYDSHISGNDVNKCLSVGKSASIIKLGIDLSKDKELTYQIKNQSKMYVRINGFKAFRNNPGQSSGEVLNSISWYKYIRNVDGYLKFPITKKDIDLKNLDKNYNGSLFKLETYEFDLTGSAKALTF